MGKLESFAKLSAFQYVAQVITIISAIFYSFIAANFLGPEKYGLIYYLMGFLVGIPSIFGVETFYDLAKVFFAKYKSRNLVKKIVFPTIIFLFILTLASMLFSDQVVSFVGKGTKELVIFLSIIIFFVPLVIFLQSVLAGFKQFGKILLLVSVQKTLDLVFLLIFLFVLHQDYLALFYSTTLSTLIVLVLTVFYVSKLKFSQIIVPDTEVNKFLSQSWISNVARGITAQVEIWMFGFLLILSDFGIFFLIKKLSSYLFETPQVAISEVILPFLSEEEKIEKLVLYTSKVVKFQIFLNVLTAIVSLALAPFVLPILFPQFLAGVSVFPILVLGYALYFGAPLARLLKATNNNNSITWAYAIYIGCIVIFGFILVPLQGLTGAVITLFIARVMMGVSFYFLCRFKGYKVDLIPTCADLIFFYSSGSALIMRGLLHMKKLLFTNKK